VLSLGWVGTNFIVNTETLSDLIVKALALQAVLNVDALLFKAMVPSDASRLLKNLEPLQLPKRHRFFGVDMRFISVVVIVASTLVAVYISLVLPRTENMDLARQHLCGGKKDFVVAYDLLGIPHALDLELPPPSSPPAELSAFFEKRNQFQTRAVRQAIYEGRRAKNDTLVVWQVALSAVEDASRQSIEAAVEYHQSHMCRDLLDDGPYSNLYRQFLSELLSGIDRPLTECKQVAHLCWSNVPVAKYVRFSCPVTCGCKSPRAPLLDNIEGQFCAPSCRRNSAFLQELGGLSCDYMSPDKLRNQSWWNLTAHRWNLIFKKSMPPSNYSIPDLMLREGCDVIQKMNTSSSIDLCNTPYTKYSDEFWKAACPTACNCTGNERGCPTCGNKGKR